MAKIIRLLLGLLIFSLGSIGLYAETERNNTTTDKSEGIDLARYLAAVDVDGLTDSVVDSVAQKGVGVSKSYLEKYFSTVELSFTTGGIYTSNSAKPKFSILVVKPLSDEEDIYNTYFTQLSASYYDNRTTLNGGLGYRKLSENKYILMGVNAFFDWEIPYNHARTSLGLEYRTTVGEMNANIYKAITDWQKGKNSFDEHALDGFDIEAGMPLPYMNWATLFVKHSRWETEISNVKDLNVNEVQLRAQIPTFPGLEIEAGRKFNSGATSLHESYIAINYNLVAAFSNDSNKKNWISDYAYRLESMEDRRYEKVRRENSIVKQSKKSGSVTVTGY